MVIPVVWFAGQEHINEEEGLPPVPHEMQPAALEMVLGGHTQESPVLPALEVLPEPRFELLSQM